MDIHAVKAQCEQIWDDSALPVLKEYITIPAVSPNYDRNWEDSGFLLQAARLVKAWCDSLALAGCRIRLVSPQGRTPLILIDVDATSSEYVNTVLFYGHIDKQPESTGWDADKGPWTPMVKNGRLYGRGAADDGYSVFCALTAIKTLQDQALDHERCVILIECAEESGSVDLEFYFREYDSLIGRPDLIICLDSGCGDYERMWLTTSLRGSISGILHVSTLTEGIHSGNSGGVASTFRILRQLLDRIEDARTGEILIDELTVDIPPVRMEQIQTAAGILGSGVLSAFPLLDGVQPATTDPVQALINQTWHPTLSYTGMDGIPPLNRAGNVLRPVTSLLLSFRTPPSADPEQAGHRIKAVLEKDPPYNARVCFEKIKHGNGWEMPDMKPAFEEIIRQSSRQCFGAEAGYLGEGGGIPLMNMLAGKFPESAFIVTGVLGPHSNAHGPNEFLHLPFVKKLTAAVAVILAQRCRRMIR